MLGFLAQRHQPVLAALAGHPQHALAQVHPHCRQVDQLAHTQARGVHQFQHGAIAQARRCVKVRRSQQGLDLTFGQGLWQRAWQVRRVDQGGGVVAARAIAQAQSVERTQGRQQPRRAARRIIRPGAPAQIVEQGGTVDAQQAATSAIAPTRQPFQIAPITLQGLPRHALLGPEPVEKPFDDAGISRLHRRQVAG